MPLKSLLITLSLLIACQASADAKPAIKVHRYASAPYAWNTNSYWLESSSGIVIIDAQLLRSDAQYFAAMIKANGKPVLGAFLTHPHPDHIAGFTELRKVLGEFPIYTTQLVKETAKTNYQQFVNSSFAKHFGEDRITEVTVPENLVKPEMRIGNMIFQIKEMGPGESPDHIVIYQPDLKALFVGDITMNHHPAYFGEGRPMMIIAQLNKLKAQFSDAEFVYSGHGDPQRTSVFDQQIAYIEAFIAEVKNARAKPDALDENGRLTAANRKALSKKIAGMYPQLSYFGYLPQVITEWNVYGAEASLMETQRQ